MGQDLVLQVVPVHPQRVRLPDPLVALQNGSGNGLERRVAVTDSLALSPPDRGEHAGRARPLLADIHRPGVADDPPDTLAIVLAVDEETLLSRGRHPDAETPEPGVAEVVGGLAGTERSDAGVGQGGGGHSCSPVCSCSREREGTKSAPSATGLREKTTLYQIVRTARCTDEKIVPINVFGQRLHAHRRLDLHQGNLTAAKRMKRVRHPDDPPLDASKGDS